MMHARLSLLPALAALSCGISVQPGLAPFAESTSGSTAAASSSADPSSAEAGSDDGSTSSEGRSTSSTAGPSACGEGSCTTSDTGTTEPRADASGGPLSSSSGSGETGDPQGSASLPFDLEVDLGDTVLLLDAFALGGPLPAEILDVTMDGGDWRLDELAGGVPFTVTQADCDHEGDHGPGRDRMTVTWENADASQGSDEVDVRYCGN